MEEVEHLNEKQEVLATPMEGKMRRQKVAPEDFEREIFQELFELEEQKTQEALELVKRKELRKERECCRGWICQGQQVIFQELWSFVRERGRITGQIGQRLRKMTPCLKERVPKSKVRKRKVKRKTTCGRLWQSAKKKQRKCAS